MNQRFIQAVAEHNLAKARLSISNELLLDPRGHTFNEMLNYALENLSDLFEDDDNSWVNSERSFWSKDYLSEFHIKLNKNFSKEKLQHFEEVAKVVLKDKIEELNSQEANYTNPSPHTNDPHQSTSNQIDRKDISYIVGGALSAIIGICVGSIPVKVTLITAGLAGIVYGAHNIHKK